MDADIRRSNPPVRARGDLDPLIYVDKGDKDRGKRMDLLSKSAKTDDRQGAGKFRFQEARPMNRQAASSPVEAARPHSGGAASRSRV